MLRGGSFDRSGMKPNFQVPIRFRRFRNPQTVSPVAWNRSRSPQRCGAGKHRPGAVGKGFFDGTDFCSCCRTAVQHR